MLGIMSEGSATSRLTTEPRQIFSEGREVDNAQDKRSRHRLDLAINAATARWTNRGMRERDVRKQLPDYRGYHRYVAGTAIQPRRVKGQTRQSARCWMIWRSATVVRPARQYLP
jgi:hypothetical protein